MKAILELELTKQLENEDVLVYRDGKTYKYSKKNNTRNCPEMKRTPLLKSRIHKN